MFLFFKDVQLDFFALNEMFIRENPFLSKYEVNQRSFQFEL